MWDGRLVVIGQIMDVDMAIREAAAGSNVEVPDDLIYTKDTLEAATFGSLFVDLVEVSFPYALFDVLTPAKSPVLQSVGFADFVASIAAACLHCVGRRGAVVAASTIVWV